MKQARRGICAPGANLGSERDAASGFSALASRRLKLYTAAAFLIVAVWAPPAMQGQVAIVDLGALCGPSAGGNVTSEATGINAAGQVAGWSTTNNPNSSELCSGPDAFLYTGQGGSMVDLGTLPGGSVSEGYGINDAGVVVGKSATASGTDYSNPYAFLYPNPIGGGMLNLGTLAVGSSHCATGECDSAAYGINDAGVIVGQSYTTIPSTVPTVGFQQHAFMYSSGVMQDLGTLGGPSCTTCNSVAKGINAAGWVVGQSGTTIAAPSGYVISHAFLYSGGVMQDLGAIPGNDYSSYAYGINAAGWVVGQSDTTTPVTNGYIQHAFLYSGGVMQDLGTLGGPSCTSCSSMAYGINSAGWVVGTSASLTSLAYAFLYSGGVMTNI
jgi:probable HAF family extracellular repeat protein